MPDQARQQGLSLIELMIALVLGTLLTLGVVQLFVSNSQTYRLNEANARVQESGRMGLEMMTRAVRGAGYYGCAPVVSDARQSVVWTDGEENGSPILVIRGAEYNRLELDEQSSDEARFTMQVRDGIEGIDLNTEMDRTFNDDDSGPDEVLVTDCRRAEIIGFSRLDDEDIVLSRSPDGDAYQEGDSVYRVVTNRYRIETDEASGEPTLMRDRDALVSGVEAMQLEFAFDDGDGGVSWEDSADQEDGRDIRGMRIALLARSDSINVVEDPMTVTFPSAPWSEIGTWSAEIETNGDDQRRLYRSYTAEVAIRNQVFRN